MDKTSESRLSAVHPKLASLIRQLAAQLLLQGIEIRAIQGLRTWQEQDALYALGRTKSGAKVTNARGGFSMHNFGYAVDVVPGKPGANPWTPLWDAEHEYYHKMVEVAESLGLVCGARWRHLPDAPHLQLSGLPVTPTQAMRDCLQSQGLPTVWTTFPPQE